VRRKAINGLGQLDDRSVLPALEQAALREQEESTLGYLIVTIERLGGSTNDDLYERVLANALAADPDVRQTAVRNLGRLRNPRAIPVARAALEHDPHDRVRGEAALCLLMLGDQEAETRFVRLINSTDPELIGTGLEGLVLLASRQDLREHGKLAPPDKNIVPRLRDLLRSWGTRHEIRQSAATALISVEDPEVFDMLAELLRSEEPADRQIGVVGLTELGDNAAIPLLADLVRDPDDRVRGAVAAAFGPFLSPEGATVLQVLVRDPSPYVRGDAVKILSIYPDELAGEWLQKLARDREYYVRARAAEGWLRYAAPMPESVLTDLLRDEEELVRGTALSYVALKKDPELPPTLIRILTDHSANLVPETTVGLLHRLVRDPAPGLVPLCVQLLKDSDPTVRAAAADCLREIASDEPVLRSL
jgi:HEAT repeat protein